MYCNMPGGKRTRRGERRLLEFQEKKRAAYVAELVAKGCTLEHAQLAVAHAESKRLELVAAAKERPMEVEAASAGSSP